MRHYRAATMCIRFGFCSLALVTIFGLSLSGCADLVTFHRTVPLNDKKSVSIDARQRVVVATKGRDGDFTVVCAEPSPDAISSISTSAGISAQSVDKVAQAAFAMAESGAYVGLRTQSIQLLRDGMYRLCEGYQGGALSADQFNRLQRRYQNMMLGLLAIEQLTGAVVARPVALGSGGSSATAGEQAAEAAEALAKAKKKREDAEKAFNDAEKARKSQETVFNSTPDTPADKKQAEKDKLDALTGDRDTKKEAFDAAQIDENTAKERLAGARGAVSAAAQGPKATIGEAAQAAKPSDSSVRYVAEASRAIVSTTIIGSFAQDQCLQFLETRAAVQKAIVDTQAANKNQDMATAAAEVDKKLRLLSPEMRQILGFTPPSQKDPMVDICTTAMGQLSIPVSPLYDGTLPLAVIGADREIALSATPVSFAIVGGVKPYDISTPEPRLNAKPRRAVKGDGMYVDIDKGSAPQGKYIVVVRDATSNAVVTIQVSVP